MNKVTLGDKTITLKDAGPWLNYVQTIRNIKELIGAGKELIRQGMEYQSELSYEISTVSSCYIFNPLSVIAPQIILDCPVKGTPHTKKFYRNERKIRNCVESDFI